jgi:hypothetical protein
VILTEDLFFPATQQQKLRLPSLRVDNSTSGKITHYFFGANSGKMVRSVKTTKTDISFYFCEKPASLRQRVVKKNTTRGERHFFYFSVGCGGETIFFYVEGGGGVS